MSNTEKKQLINIVYDRLRSSEFYTEKTRENGHTIQNLICPECKKPRAWAYAINDSGKGPYEIICNRGDKCGEKTNTIDEFNIRRDIEKEFKPTKDDPNRPARVFLESRGLNYSLNGLDYNYWENVRNSGSGAAMFSIGEDESGRKVYNGRLITPGRKESKSHNSGSTAGQYWQHPGRNYDSFAPTFVTEGILDALSLWEMGHQAIAALSSGQLPDKLDLSNFKNIILAFDSDTAGISATKKWKRYYPEASAILPDKTRDWNDILCSGTLDQVKKRFNESYSQFETNAQLALASSAQEYANIYYGFWRKVAGIFTFDGCTYFSTLKKRGDENQLLVERCGKFQLKVISYFRDNSNPDHPEYRYQLQITPRRGRPITITASGKDLATPRGIKEFFLTRSRVCYEASAQSCTALATMITSAQKAPEVSQLSLTGYDLKSGWYIFKYFGIDRTGKLHFPDNRGFYKINQQDWLVPPPHAVDKVINPTQKAETVQKIYNLIVSAWGTNGAVAFAWVVAGWFVNQIKEQLGFFPFASFYGDPGSGKSALTVILNAIQGIDGEGLPLSQLNTKKALARSISRVSGMFTALLEDNQRNERAFDYSVLLTAYNQGPLQLKATFSNDNRTTESPFQGSMLFVQNTEPFIQKAEKQRVISLHFEHSILNESSRAAYEELTKLPLPKLTNIVVQTLQFRKKFEEEWVSAYNKAIDDLGQIENRRILQNHALVLGFHRIFCGIFCIDFDITEFVHETAEIKCNTSAARSYTQADHFFETIDQVEDTKAKSCIHYDLGRKLILINLPGVEQLIRNKGVQFYINNQLTDALTQHPAFLENGKRFRFPEDPDKDSSGRPRQRRVWVFSAEKFD